MKSAKKRRGWFQGKQGFAQIDAPLNRIMLYRWKKGQREELTDHQKNVLNAGKSSRQNIAIASIATTHAKGDGYDKKWL